MSDVIDINPTLREHGIKNEAEMIKELESLFNRLSIDSQLNTPDYMLAEAVAYYLLDLKLLLDSRRKWGCK